MQASLGPRSRTSTIPTIGWSLSLRRKNPLHIKLLIIPVSSQTERLPNGIITSLAPISKQNPALTIDVNPWR